MVFEDVKVFEKKIKRYFENTNHLFRKNKFLAFLFVNFKAKMASKKSELREKEMKDSYICDIVNSTYSTSFIIVDEKGTFITG